MAVNIPQTIRKSLPIFFTGMAVTLLCVLLYVFEPHFLQHLTGRFYDLALEQVHSTGTSGVPLIIDIDEKSLTRQGQWPWPRYRVALLIEKMRAMGAAAVVMDIIFSEPDRTSPAVIQETVKKDLGLDIGFSGLPEQLRDHDRLLAKTIAKGGVGLACYFRSDNDRTRTPETLPQIGTVVLRNAGAPPPEYFLLEADTATVPIASLMRTAAAVGFTNTIPDRDGILRRTPLLIASQGRLYPSLSLAALQAAMGPVPSVLRVSSGGIESLKFGPTTIPLDRNGQMLIHFRGPERTFPFVSATDILEDRVSAAQLAGKIVFIGSSAAGLKDIRTTPLAAAYPGVEAQATVVDNILKGDFLWRPDWAPGFELSSILFFGLAITVLIAAASARWTLPVTVGSGLVIWTGAVQALGIGRISLSPIIPLVALAANFAVLTVLKFWMEERDKRFLRSAFARYVPEKVVAQIASRPESLSLEGEEKDVSILFSDLQGFTTLSERLAPTEVTELLRDYFTPMTRLILEHQGTFDKFIGDALMAFWNAPVDVPGHRGQAVGAALGMIAALEELNRTRIVPRFGFRIGMGIGLHAGTVRVGNMGSEDLFDYTVIGDNVNLASRLEGLCRYYGTAMVFSAEMVSSCPQSVLVQELDRVQVKGKQEPLTIYTAVPASGEEAAAVAVQHRGLELFRAMAFKEARDIFAGLAEAHPQTKLYQLYRQRCVDYLAAPPESPWDGVYRHTSK